MPALPVNAPAGENLDFFGGSANAGRYVSRGHVSARKGNYVQILCRSSDLDAASGAIATCEPQAIVTPSAVNCDGRAVLIGGSYGNPANSGAGAVGGFPTLATGTVDGNHPSMVFDAAGASFVAQYDCDISIRYPRGGSGWYDVNVFDAPPGNMQAANALAQTWTLYADGGGVTSHTLQVPRGARFASIWGPAITEVYGSGNKAASGYVFAETAAGVLIPTRFPVMGESIVVVQPAGTTINVVQFEIDW